jgi:hypothetical protein
MGPLVKALVQRHSINGKPSKPAPVQG